MRARRSLAAVLLLVMCGTALSGEGRQFALYHESMAARSTALVAMNLDSTQTAVTFAIYDASGTRLAERETVLAGQASDALFLDDVLGERDGTAWGLVLAETDGHVAFGVWIASDDAWQCVENVVTALLDPANAPYAAYWYAADYASTGNRNSGLAIVNPWADPVTAEIEVHDASGDVVTHVAVDLDGRASGYYNLSGALSADASLWGAVLVRATRPILLVTEYRDEGSGLIDLDMITQFFYVEQ